jgi:hypothetical protein
LYNYAGTRESVEASERRRSLILAHRDKLSKEEVAFLEELVPYVAELPEKAAAVFSQADPPADQLKRAFTDCKHRNLLIHPYADKVKSLHSLIDDIYERNTGRFENTEEIFELFAEAVVIGNVIPVGRLIDRTFGQGSFRRLGKGEEIVPSGN